MTKEVEQCPECGDELEKLETGKKCPSCGFGYRDKDSLSG